MDFDLTNVYILGDLRGQPAVWILFYFYSDVSITDDGTFLDDITIWRHLPDASASHIDSIVPNSGPAHADELGSAGCAADSTSIVINGSNFGSTQGSSYVRFELYPGFYVRLCLCRLVERHRDPCQGT